MSTAPSMSASLAMSPRSAAVLNMSISHLRTSASKAAEMRAISGWRRASAITSVQSFTCSIGRTAKW